jgi:hypothetical protein
MWRQLADARRTTLRGAAAFSTCNVRPAHTALTGVDSVNRVAQVRIPPGSPEMITAIGSYSVWVGAKIAPIRDEARPGP